MKISAKDQHGDVTDSPLPKHQRIFEAVLADIESGRYQPGSFVPSEMQLVRRFGVSRPTAARALRDLQAAGYLIRKVGAGTYVRQTANKQGHFGLLAPGFDSREFLGYISAAIFRQAQREHISVLWSDSAQEGAEVQSQQHVEELCRRYVAQRVQGVFLVPLEFVPHAAAANQRLIELLQQARIPVVLIDRDVVALPQRSNFDLVGIDNFISGRRVTEHLLQHGCRRIRFVALPGSAATTTVALRIAGMQDALLRAGLPIEANGVAYGDPADEQFVRSLLSAAARRRADAIICVNDLTAARLLRTMSRLGLAVPDDVCVAAFDDVKYAELLSPPLTTIRQPYQAIGSAAVQAMLERIRKPNLPPRTILLDAPLVVRESCGCHAQSH